MADFQALQQKYAPVVDMTKKFEPYGATLQVVLQRVWDIIKQVDPQYADLKHTGHRVALALPSSRC